MNRALRLQPLFFAALLSWYALSAFIMVTVGLAIQDSVGRGWAVWLGWPLAITAGSMAGVRLRLMLNSRLLHLLPASRSVMGRAVILFLVVSCLPAWLMAIGSPFAFTLAVGTLALALLGLTIGLRFGPNGIIWMAVIVVLMDVLFPGDVVGWLLQANVSMLVLAGLGVVALTSWRLQARRMGLRDRYPGRLRRFLRDRPGQPLGWRLLLAYLTFGVLVILVPMGVRMGWPDPDSLDDFMNISWGLAFISTVLLAITVASEMFRFRGNLRFFFLLPGQDRDHLRWRAARGLGRAVLVLGAVPQAALVVLAAFSSAASLSHSFLLALMVVSILAVIAALVLQVVAVEEHATAVVALIGLALMGLIMGPGWYWLWHLADSIPQTLTVLVLAWATAACAWAWARKAWSRLSLQRVDHWPLIKLAEKSSFG